MQPNPEVLYLQNPGPRSIPSTSTKVTKMARRSPAQRAATRKMIAANKRARAGKASGSRPRKQRRLKHPPTRVIPSSGARSRIMSHYRRAGKSPRKGLQRLAWTRGHYGSKRPILNPFRGRARAAPSWRGTKGIVNHAKFGGLGFGSSVVIGAATSDLTKDSDVKDRNALITQTLGTAGLSYGVARYTKSRRAGYVTALFGLIPVGIRAVVSYQKGHLKSVSGSSEMAQAYGQAYGNNPKGIARSDGDNIVYRMDGSISETTEPVTLKEKAKSYLRKGMGLEATDPEGVELLGEVEDRVQAVSAVSGLVPTNENPAMRQVQADDDLGAISGDEETVSGFVDGEDVEGELDGELDGEDVEGEVEGEDSE